MSLRLFEFNKVLIGIRVGCQELSRMVDMLFGDLKQKFVYNFMDDLVVYSRSLTEHLGHLEEVSRGWSRLDLLEPRQAPAASGGECFSGVSSVGQEVKTLPQRVDAIPNIPTPKNRKGVLTFLGMVGFYERFIKIYRRMRNPSTR
jgi:hypothetical protein